MAAIFNFSVIRTSDSVRSSLVVLPELKKLGKAAEILLQSCIEAEIRFITFLQPPSWIPGFRFHLAVFLMVTLKSSSLKTLGWTPWLGSITSDAELLRVEALPPPPAVR